MIAGRRRTATKRQGVKRCLLLKVSTDEGIIGWSDVETAPHVGAATVNAPASGMGVFEGLKTLVVGEDPFEVERLWDKVYRGSIYYGGAALRSRSFPASTSPAMTSSERLSGDPFTRSWAGRTGTASALTLRPCSARPRTP
jgi:hypothetical protein